MLVFLFFYSYTIINDRIFNVSTKIFKDNRTIVIFPIYYYYHFAWFQLALSLFWSHTTMQNEDCLYLTVESLVFLFIF